MASHLQTAVSRVTFFTVLAGAVLAGVCLAAERAPKQAPTVLMDRAESAVPVIEDSEQALAVGNYVGQRDDGTVSLAVGLKGANVSYRFEVLAEADSVLEPKDLSSMWGTRDGKAALAQALEDMLAGGRVSTRRLDASTGGFQGPVEAAAIFERDGVATHLLVVHFENDNAVFEELAVAGLFCNAAPQGGDCGCSASGSGKSCTSGKDTSTGITWAKCTDSTGTTDCTYNGHLCACADAQ